MSRYAFINAERVVVQVIVGELDEIQRAQFLRDYSVLFRAEEVLAVESDAIVWIGGSYDSDSGTFTPPPTPEPEVVVAEAVEVIVPETVAVIEEILPE